MKDASETQRLVYSMDQLIDGLGLPKVIQPQRTRNTNVVPFRRQGSRDLPAEMQEICGNGERTEHLTRLAGKLIVQGRPLDEVIELARSWNSRNTPPLPDEKVVSTCQSIMRTDTRRTAPLGELVVAAFDAAARYSADPQEVSRLAASVVMDLLRRSDAISFTESDRRLLME